MDHETLSSQMPECRNEPTVEQNGQALRILVVEDHEDTASSLALLLGMYGHEVQVAPDGPTALRACQVGQPDVVLVDIGLPGMDGWEVARQVREQSTQKRPFLVAVTGYGTDVDRLRSQEAGIDLHLVKPVDAEALEQLLDRFGKVLN